MMTAIKRETAGSAWNRPDHGVSQIMSADAITPTLPRASPMTCKIIALVPISVPPFAFFAGLLWLWLLCAASDRDPLRDRLSVLRRFWEGLPLLLFTSGEVSEGSSAVSSSDSSKTVAVHHATSSSSPMAEKLAL